MSEPSVALRGRSPTPQAGVEPSEPLRKVAAVHPHWTSDLILGANGRLRHAANGSLGAWREEHATLHVTWDGWPPESFLERDGRFVSSAMPCAPAHRCSIVVCARWETAHIAEWLTYHAGIGFDHVYLYCNDDDPAELYREVLPFLCGPSPFATFLHFPFLGQQRRMYQHFIRTAFHDSRWVSFLDVDEFLHLPRDGDVNALTRRIEGDADVMYFNWLNFGTNGFVERPPGSVLEQYTRHEPFLHPNTKVLVKTAAADPEAPFGPQHVFWHDWCDPSGKMRKRNALMEPMEGYYAGFPARATERIRQPGVYERTLVEAVLCHFNMKSEADFKRRVLRGTAGDFSAQAAWGRAADAAGFRNDMDKANVAELLGLRECWRALTGPAAVPSVLGRPAGRLLSAGRPAMQSSVCAWSKGKDAETDAAGAVSGLFTGAFQFHTDTEEGPWWQVDLGAPARIGEVRLYNRLDNAAERARRLVISVSQDGRTWREAFRKDTDEPFGGVDGFPLRWTPETPPEARFVRVSLIGRTCLHLDQVEVYGAAPGT